MTTYALNGGNLETDLGLLRTHHCILLVPVVFIVQDLFVASIEKKQTPQIDSPFVRSLCRQLREKKNLPGHTIEWQRNLCVLLATVKHSVVHSG